jgi:hypothetical protein
VGRREIVGNFFRKFGGLTVGYGSGSTVKKHHPRSKATTDSASAGSYLFHLAKQANIERSEAKNVTNVTEYLASEDTRYSALFSDSIAILTLAGIPLLLAYTRHTFRFEWRDTY